MKHHIVAGACLLSLTLAAPVWGAGEEEAGAGTTTIEFIQWWQLEMAEGSFDGIMADFEAANPGLQVSAINLPYPQVQDQINVGAAGGTLPDVIGIDPPRIKTFIDRNVVEPLDECIAREGIDIADMAGAKRIDGSYWMLPVVSFIYPLYYNVDLLEAAGFSEPPRDQDEFMAYARALTDPDQNRYGWALPLSLQLPNGVSNDTFPWLWTGGDTVMMDGRPNLDSPEMVAALTFVNEMYQQGLLTPGTLTKMETEKVEEFATGRAAMVITPTAHINLLRQRNPDLNFDITPVPGPAGYDGPPASRVVGWAIGISRNSQNKEAACKLVAHMVDQQTNGEVSSAANAFPGNLKAEPDFIKGDPIYTKAFEIFTQAQLRSELVGLPNTTELERAFAEQMHSMFAGKQSPADTAAAAQSAWEEIIAEG